MVDNINGMVFSQALRLLTKDIDKTMVRVLKHPTGHLVLIGLPLTSFSMPERGIRNETRDWHHSPSEGEDAVETVKLEIKEKIAIITINRPEKRNALNDPRDTRSLLCDWAEMAYEIEKNNLGPKKGEWGVEGGLPVLSVWRNLPILEHQKTKPRPAILLVNKGLQWNEKRWYRYVLFYALPLWGI